MVAPESVKKAARRVSVPPVKTAPTKKSAAKKTAAKAPSPTPAPKPAGAKRGPKPKGTLSHEIVARTGLELLDQAGLEDFSLRGVAGKLGIRPNAIYTYFPTRTALETGIVDLVLAQGDLTLLFMKQDWRERIKNYALSLREALLQHPGAAPLLMTSPMDGPRALNIAEQLLRAFTDAGLSGPDGARAVYPLLTYIIGSVSLEMADSPATKAPLPSEVDRIASRRDRFANIDFDSWPGLHSARSVVGRWPSTGQFTWGLERLLDGLIAAPAE